MSVKISPAVQMHLPPIQEKYFPDNEKLVRTSSLQGNSVAAFDFLALVISPVLKDKFLARIFVMVLPVNALSCWKFCSWSQLQHLHGLVLSKSPVAEVSSVTKQCPV